MFFWEGIFRIVWWIGFNKEILKWKWINENNLIYNEIIYIEIIIKRGEYLKMENVMLKVKGMLCGYCVNLIEGVLN